MNNFYYHYSKPKRLVQCQMYRQSVYGGGNWSVLTIDIKRKVELETLW